MQPSLERHLELAGTGDVGAFATVFDLTSTRVFGTVLRILLDRAQAEEVAQELHEVGSALPPAEGESLEAFRHLAIGVGYEWCDLLYVDEERIGDADEHAEQAQRYGWTTEEYRVVVEEAEGWLCGY